MTIILKNKVTLLFDDFVFRCAIGKKGLTKNKFEGDKKTPIGRFSLGNLYYRNDRHPKPFTKLKCIPIKKNMGWCDDIRSKKYNHEVLLPFKFSTEKLYRNENSYDAFINIKYNYFPVYKKKGSAIFLHLTNKKYKPTKGCIAITKMNMRKIISKINKRSKITIY